MRGATRGNPVFGGNSFWSGVAVGASVVVGLALLTRAARPVAGPLVRACAGLYREALAELEAESGGDVIAEAETLAEAAL